MLPKVEYPSVEYLSECTGCGETFQWGFAEGESKAHITTKLCECPEWSMVFSDREEVK